MRSCIPIHGAWMYPPDATGRLAGLIRAGLLRLNQFATKTFALDQVNEAVTHAAENAGQFKMTVIKP
jgi:Zn-dependent alcohol dehydrogenase